MNERLTFEDVEFLAEDTLVTIVPKFKHVSLHFISVPTEVPLWLAVTLKRRQQCQIQAPDWLEEDNLREAFESDRRAGTDFSKLPFHYLEVASLLFTYASDDIVNADKLRSLLEDIQNVRQHKMRTGVDSVVDQTRRSRVANAVRVTNAAAMEVQCIRPYFMRALDALYRTERVELAGGDMAPPPPEHHVGAVQGGVGAGAASAAEAAEAAEVERRREEMLQRLAQRPAVAVARRGEDDAAAAVAAEDEVEGAGAGAEEEGDGGQDEGGAGD